MGKEWSKGRQLVVHLMGIGVGIRQLKGQQLVAGQLVAEVGVDIPLVGESTWDLGVKGVEAVRLIVPAS
jgi:hypothetical protein